MKNLPGRRVAGAGVEVAARGFCVTMVGLEDFESFDDLDIVDKVLSRAEGLRDPFLKRLKGMLLCCEKCLVEEMEAEGWYEVVSYTKGMIGCYSEKPRRRSKCIKVRYRKWLDFICSNICLEGGNHVGEVELTLILFVAEAVSELSDLMGKQKSVTTLMATFILFTFHGF